MARDLMAPIWCWWPTSRSGGARKCPMPAGHNTDHPGYGPCRTHEPVKMRRAWEKSMAMARELDVSPWEALTMAVRIAAARVEWVDTQLRSLTNEVDGNANDHRVLELMKESRMERKLLASTAKAAIDAGVAERLIRQVELEGKVLADALDVALTAAGLGPDERLVALEAAHHRLAASMEPASGIWGVPGTASGPYTDPDDATDLDDGRGPERGSSDASGG